MVTVGHGGTDSREMVSIDGQNPLGPENPIHVGIELGDVEPVDGLARGQHVHAGVLERKSAVGANTEKRK